MNSDRPDLVFVPVTRGQAHLFAGIGRMLDRRGVVCQLAAPSAEIAETLLDEWGDRVSIASDTQGRRTATDPVSNHIGAYDAWRGGWSEDCRAEAAEAAMRFWRDFIRAHPPGALVLWNGRDDLFVEAAAAAAREVDADVICMELGPLRRRPMTVALSREGINAAATFRRPDKLSEPLVEWEAKRLQAVRDRFSADIRHPDQSDRYVFLPLQVDDDTQLYYYAPHFADQRAMVRAAVEAMPDNLPLVIKPHPLCDPRFGRAYYAPLLRGIDRIAPSGADTLGLIAGATTVVTHNSSAGIEALMLDRPVVVLGEAHYGGKGFTYDYAGGDELGRLIASAVHDALGETEKGRRDRYLYELLFHELAHIEHHPLNDTLDDEEYESLAVRLWDLVRPDWLGSDWLPLFNEMHSIRGRLEGAIRNEMKNSGADTILIASRFAASCLGDVQAGNFTVLEDLVSGLPDTVADHRIYLLTPDLSVGQRAAVMSRLREAGARVVLDLMHRLSRQPCGFHVDRFNRLPRAMRDNLHRTSEYWDYYLTQSGISAENTPEKTAQAVAVADRLRERSPKTVLEYGCGDGRILERLSTERDRPWKKLVGVDSSERMLRLARERLKHADGVTLLPADAREALPFADGFFDATLTCGALQHVHADDLPAVLHQLHRVTARTRVHWETFEAFKTSPGDHYTNPGASRAIHEHTFARFGPVRMQVEDARPLNGGEALLVRYDTDQPLITVLTLHAIGDAAPDCDSLDYRNMFLSQRLFRELLDGLARRGYRFLSPGEAMACARGEMSPPMKPVVLTFDDAYSSVFDAARPLLEERGIRAAVFVPTGTIGRPFGGNTREGRGPALPSMTEGQLLALRDAGWTVGSHSVSHRAFSTLTDENAKRELAESKARLDNLLGSPVSMFAFPYGEPDVAYQPRHVEMAGEAGYDWILTMQPGFVSIGQGGIAWPRVGVGADTTVDGLLSTLANLHRETSGWPRLGHGHRSSLGARVRGAVKRCMECGLDRIALYGAGRHTARLMETTSLWPLHVLGIIDDDVSLKGARRHGLPIYASADISDLKPDAVLISSDQYEASIYRRIAPLEARGIRVLRLYPNE
ncbi:MAG: polysaccharide deacetylase family protein [Phycisphaerae bacterium]